MEGKGADLIVHSATPAEIGTFLAVHFTEESILAYQQEVGRAACRDATENLHYTAENMAVRDDYHDGYLGATQEIDPDDVYYAGPFPDRLHRPE